MDRTDSQHQSEQSTKHSILPLRTLGDIICFKFSVSMVYFQINNLLQLKFLIPINENSVQKLYYNSRLYGVIVVIVVFRFIYSAVKQSNYSFFSI